MSKKLIKKPTKELFFWLRFWGIITLVAIGFNGTAWSGAHIKPWTFLNITTPASIPLAMSFWFSLVIVALMAISVRRRLDKVYPVVGIPCLVLSLILTGLIFFATTALANALIVALAILAGSAMGLGIVTFAYRDNIMKASSGQKPDFVLSKNRPSAYFLNLVAQRNEILGSFCSIPEYSVKSG